MSHPTASISRALLLLSVGTWACTAHLASAGMPDPWTTTFTYQGQLREAGQPATGLYDFEVCLYDSAVNPVSLACIAPADDVPVEDGLFALDLDFGPGHFSGQPRYLELRVRQGDSAGGYTQLLPRQPLRPTPEAMHAAGVPWAGISGVPAGFADGIDDAGVTQISTGFGLIGGTITSTGTVSVNTNTVQTRVGSSCSAGSAIRAIAQDGTVTCDAAPAAWLLGGNAGTNPASQYLGTSDNQPLSLRANAQRVARFEAIPQSGFHTANVLLGSPQNTITAGIRGATVGGGGAPALVDPEIGALGPNRVFDHYGTVAGGVNNLAGSDDGDPLTNRVAFVGGGIGNRASGFRSVVTGGANNQATATSATVAGGVINQATNQSAAVGGGENNRSSGVAGVVAGGQNNVASGSYASVGGGIFNEAAAVGATAIGGITNTASGSASVAGGDTSCAGGVVSWAMGRRAKVRPGLNSGAPGSGCNGVEVVGANGDQGTFVWSDSQAADFISTGSNQFLIRADGGVGIGTNAPQNQLHVRRSINANANAENHVVQFENPSTGASPDVLALKVGTTNPGDSVNFISFLHGGATSLGSIEGNGSGGVVLAGPGNDFAEYLPRRDPDERIAPGDVIGVRAGQVSRDTDGAELVLVASSSPIIAGNDPGHAQRGLYVLSAMLGQVVLRVNGPVRTGDLLLPSGRGDGLARALPASASLNPADVAQIIGQVLVVETPDTNPPAVRALVGLGARELANARVLQALQQENHQLREQLLGLAAGVAALQQRIPGATLSASGN